MSLLDKIKLPFLRPQTQTNRHDLVAMPPAEQAANAPRILNVLDKAVAELESPAPARKDAEFTPREMAAISSLADPEAIKANRIRQELREDTKRNIEQNRLNAEKTQLEKAELTQKQLRATVEKSNSWETIFKPYYRTEVNLIISKEFLVRLIRFGELHDARAECAARVAPLLLAWDVAFEARTKNTRAEVKRQLLEDIEYNAGLLKQGISDLRPVHMESDIEKRFSIVRGQCRDRMFEVANEFNPVLLEFTEQLQKAARKLVNQTFVNERSEAESFGIAFEPSATFKFLVCAAFSLGICVKNNFLASASSSPRETLYGLLDPKTTW